MITDNNDAFAFYKQKRTKKEETQIYVKEFTPYTPVVIET